MLQSYVFSSHRRTFSVPNLDYGLINHYICKGLAMFFAVCADLDV